ncbi:MAG: type VI secretion system tip protein VgrG, partial [Cupriavidus sp.]|nr:type VI secretion system tip protein VgrG [Cupriavidus sp.]
MSINLKKVISQARTVTISSAAMPSLAGMEALEFLSVHGTERLGRLYEYEVQLRTPDDFHVPVAMSANIDLKALIGKEMTLRIQIDGAGIGPTGGLGAGKREISGVVTSAGFIRQEGRHNIYRVVLRPWLWLATLTNDYKIYQDKTVIEIIDDVLAEYPYPVEKRLDVVKYALATESERNDPRKFQVQYGETDFDFIQRLMEEWGIYWFFEHEDSKHRLVLCDHVGAHRRSPSEAYHTIEYHAPGAKIDVEHISEFSVQEALRPGRVEVDDFDFTRSRARLLQANEQPRGTAWSDRDLFQWPGDYVDTRHGDMLSRVRMEEMRAAGSRAFGSGNLRGLACGGTFVLARHAQREANRDYLVISSTLDLKEIGDETGTGRSYECRNEFEVQPTDEVFRMPRETPKPFTHGPQSAIVVGPPGSTVWTDEFGRIKIRFLWDRYARNDESDSCWVRVVQAWAGAKFGSIYIPRVGHEVIVNFMNGDPDRPLVTGCLYNNATLPPWDLPANATKSGFKSQTPGGSPDNYNGIRLEDKAGSEEFYLQAEKDMNSLIKNNESQTVGANRTVGIGGAYNIAVGGLLSTIVGGMSSHVVGGAYSLNVAGVAGVNVGGAYGIKVLGLHTVAVGGAYATDVVGAYTLTVGMAYMVNTLGACVINAGQALTLTCGASSLTMLPNGTIQLAGKHVVIQGSSKLDLNPGSDGKKGGGGKAAALEVVRGAAFAVAAGLPLVPIVPPLLAPGSRVT